MKNSDLHTHLSAYVCIRASPHVCPSAVSVYPTLQVHWYDPTVFAQYWWQGLVALSLMHSFKSEKNKEGVWIQKNMSNSTAQGSRWMGFPPESKPDTDHLMKEGLGRHCLQTFETAKRKKEKWCCRETNPGPLSVFCHWATTHTNNHPSFSPFYYSVPGDYSQIGDNCCVCCDFKLRIWTSQQLSLI